MNEEQLNEEQLSVSANWEARKRDMEKLSNRMVWFARISSGFLIVLIFLPFSMELKLLITVLLVFQNALLLLISHKKSKALEQYLRESALRLMNK